MIFTRRTWMIGMLGALCTHQAAIAEKMRPIIIMQAPEASGSEFVAEHADKVLHTHPRQVTPSREAEPVAVAPSPAVNKVSTPVNAAAPAAEVSQVPAPTPPTTETEKTTDVESLPIAAPTTAVSETSASKPVSETPARPADSAEAAQPIALPPAKRSSSGKPVVIPQAAENSGAAFIAAHAPIGMAQPIPNLKLTMLGLDTLPLRKTSIELIDSDGNIALKTVSCDKDFLVNVKPGVYHLNVTFDNFLVTQNVTVTDAILNAYQVPIPTYSRADSGPTPPPSAVPTPLHVLLDTLHLLPKVAQQRCP